MPDNSRRAVLSWSGGLHSGDPGSIAGFRIHGSAKPYGPVDYSDSIAEVPADDGVDALAWTSDPLPPGRHSFAVVPCDRDGNAGIPVAIAIDIPPADRSPMPDQIRSVREVAVKGGFLGRVWATLAETILHPFTQSVLVFGPPGETGKDEVGTATSR